MNWWKQVYLRLFKGWWLMKKHDKQIVEMFTRFSDKRPVFIRVSRDYWLVSPPQDKGKTTVSF